MSQSITVGLPITTRPAADSEKRTRRLLAAGALAGPLFIVVAAAQAVFRDGFDLTRHPVSLLSNGDLGWIQIANFLVTGTLILAAAAGLRQTLSSGPGATWVPRLIALVGAGMLAAGVLVADPAKGFPIGTPPGAPEQVSWHGGLHFLAAGLAFIALIAACFVVGRRLAATGRNGLANYSRAVGATFVLGWAVAMAAPDVPAANVLFAVAVALGLHWLSLISVSLDCHDRRPARTAG